MNNKTYINFIDRSLARHRDIREAEIQLEKAVKEEATRKRRNASATKSRRVAKLKRLIRESKQHTLTLEAELAELEVLGTGRSKPKFNLKNRIRLRDIRIKRVEANLLRPDNSVGFITELKRELKELKELNYDKKE